jgi:hypothetical protein
MTLVFLFLCTILFCGVPHIAKVHELDMARRSEGSA